MRPLPPELAAYLDGATPEQRAALLRLRKTILGAIPEATEKLSYGIHGFVVGKPVVWMGHFRGHLSLFGAHSGAALAKMTPGAGLKVVGSTIRFQPGKDLPASLVKRIVKARLADIAPTKARPARKAASKSVRKP